MRYLILLSALTLAACSSAPSHELPQTSDNDPTWQLNEGKWTFNQNALITPPPAPADKRLPAAAKQGGPGL
jgi:hypothetical protein